MEAGRSILHRGTESSPKHSITEFVPCIFYCIWYMFIYLPRSWDRRPCLKNKCLLSCLNVFNILFLTFIESIAPWLCVWKVSPDNNFFISYIYSSQLKQFLILIENTPEHWLNSIQVLHWEALWEQNLSENRFTSCFVFQENLLRIFHVFLRISHFANTFLNVRHNRMLANILYTIFLTIMI